MTRTIAISITVVIALAAGLASAQSKMTAEQILQMVDENLTKVEDTSYDAQVSVVRGGKTIKTMRFVAQLKGLMKKRITFTAPGDVRGMSILTTEDGRMYVYMPSYRRVRRVASHVRNQGFMGTDVSADEMGMASLSVGWKARIEKETDDGWVLHLTPAEGNETAYKYLRVTVSRTYRGVTRIASYSAQGKLVKTQTRSKWRTFGAVTIPTYFVYEDHRTGSKTILEFFDCKVNQGIPDSAFTQRALMRSR